MTNSLPTRERYTFPFLMVVVFFITCLIISNIIAVKVVAIGDLSLPAAIIIFPISYIFGDILTEVYGYRQARRVIWLGFVCNLFAVVAIYVAQLLPAAVFWSGQQAYEQILGFTPKILIASFVAYLVGEFANSIVMSKLKVATQGRQLWLRTISSTLIGQGLDSIIFITIAFLGVMPSSTLLSTIFTQWLVKVLYEVIATPLTYIIVQWLKKYEGIDTYDLQISFNPLKVIE